MRFIELERIIKKDGWLRKNSNGSHIHYIHPTKKGKVTIPNHPGDLDPKTVNSVLKSAGIK
ncbi:MAG: type II toxin-antitoxin system HicA family toxin [Selenomonas artemidis]|nr:type II toxin-antitoxin system HicA family toxin [Selenomonas artemidis]